MNFKEPVEIAMDGIAAQAVPVAAFTHSRRCVSTKLRSHRRWARREAERQAAQAAARVPTADTEPAERNNNNNSPQEMEPKGDLAAADLAAAFAAAAATCRCGGILLSFKGPIETPLGTLKAIEASIETLRGLLNQPLLKLRDATCSGDLPPGLGADFLNGVGNTFTLGNMPR